MTARGRRSSSSHMVRSSSANWAGVSTWPPFHQSASSRARMRAWKSRFEGLAGPGSCATTAPTRALPDDNVQPTSRRHPFPDLTQTDPLPAAIRLAGVPVSTAEAEESAHAESSLLVHAATSLPAAAGTAAEGAGVEPITSFSTSPNPRSTALLKTHASDTSIRSTIA